ncbi:putative secretory lipase [Whalleya microplaca]|nr:putative secretory lipase [Whalleya microplaca]
MYSLQSALQAAVAATLMYTRVSPVIEQSTGFNSTFALSPSQIKSANLTSPLVDNINTVVNFDRSQLANGGPAEDNFYDLPPLPDTSEGLKPGTLLKVQPFTRTAPFALPPNTALSRILYTTTNINGTVLPTSGFILWPFTPKQFQHASSTDQEGTKAPVVVWTHGTEGWFASHAPSTHRALWYGDAGPFALALAGYAVVGPDYAGLGVSKTWDGRDIPHQYLVSPTAAHDALHAMRAALAAFPDKLDPRFVVMGHSQGGGAAWAAAEVLASEADAYADLVPGFLGAVAVSPTTSVFSVRPEFILPWGGLMLDSVFPAFDLGDWLTPLGVARARLLREVGGGIGVSTQLFLSGEPMYKEDYADTWYADAYARIANAGRKPFRGPLLVLLGSDDIYIPEDDTAATVRATCDVNPGGDLEFFVVNGTTHVPTLTASRQIFLKWIEDRFERRALTKTGCVRTDLASFLPHERYQHTGNSFPQWAGASEYSYQVPLGP